MNALEIAAVCVLLYLASFTASARMIRVNEWVSDCDYYRRTRGPGVMIALTVLAAIPLAFVWPAVAIAFRETAAERQARQRREVAEHALAEAKALRERERELGL